MNDKDNNNFILLSLDDEKAKDIANVVNNSTCKDILNYLVKKEDTQTNIAKELHLPLPTVHYNLKQLEKAGLVVNDNYRLSEKGKEIKYFKLAQKYIIIAPKKEERENILKKLSGIFPAFLLSAFASFMIYLYFNVYLNGSNVMSKSLNNNIMYDASNEAITDSFVAAESKVAPEITTDLVNNSSNLFWNEPFMWFLYGTLFALVLVVILRYLRRNK